MATIGNLIKKERERLKLNQSEFGLKIDLIMTDVSKIENHKKKFPFEKLNNLTKLLNLSFEEIKDIYVAEKLAEEANKYKCSNIVFELAEQHTKYLRDKKSVQGKLEI